MTEYSVIYEENAPSMLLLIASSFILITWTMANFPNLQINTTSVLTVGLIYTVFLVFITVFFMMKVAYQEAPGAIIDLGDPENSWLNIAVGVLLGVFAAIAVMSGALAKPAAIAFTITQPIQFIFVCLAAPFIEELFFRGWLLPTISQYLGLPVGIFLTSILFSFYHVSTWGAIGLIGYLVPFIIGFLFAFATIRFQSVAPAIIGHMTLNTITQLLTMQETTASASFILIMVPLLAFGANQLSRRIVKKFFNGASIHMEKGNLKIKIAGKTIDPPITTIFGVIYIVWVIVGLKIVSDWWILYYTYKTGDLIEYTFSGLTMIIPYKVFSVLIPCHIMLIPWTLAEALFAFSGGKWLKSSTLWMLIYALPLTTTENVFTYWLGGSLPALCICLFDAITDAILLPILEKI